MTRARDIANLGNNTTNLETLDALYGDNVLTGRNLIINGSFTVAQRGTSATVTTGSAPLTVDRFSTTIANLDQASLTESQDSAVPSGQGFANSFKVVVGGTAETTLDADEQVYIRYQGIEGQDAQHLAFGTSSAKKTTLSFWVRSGVTGNYAVLMYTNNGIGGASPRSQTLTYTVNSADTWEYKTITFDGDGASGNALANDTSAELQLYFSLAAGSNSTATDGTSWGAYAQGKFAYGQTANLIGTASAAFYITGVKLEVGETATDFVHRSYGEELALCQRYYYKIGPHSAGEFGSGLHNTTSQATVFVPFQVQMRTRPTAVERSSTIGNFDVRRDNTISLLTSMAYQSATKHGTALVCNHAGSATQGEATVIRFRTQNDWVAWSAEL
jgi:hypothetical protein